MNHNSQIIAPVNEIKIIQQSRFWYLHGENHYPLLTALRVRSELIGWRWRPTHLCIPTTNSLCCPGLPSYWISKRFTANLEVHTCITEANIRTKRYKRQPMHRLRNSNQQTCDTDQLGCQPVSVWAVNHDFPNDGLCSPDGMYFWKI